MSIGTSLGLALDVMRRPLGYRIYSYYIRSYFAISGISFCFQKLPIRRAISLRGVATSLNLTKSCGKILANYCTSKRLEMNSITRSEEHTSELQSRGQLVCRLLLE